MSKRTRSIGKCRFRKTATFRTKASAVAAAHRFKKTLYVRVIGSRGHYKVLTRNTPC